jgi:hypothetical protein
MKNLDLLKHMVWLWGVRPRHGANRFNLREIARAAYYRFLEKR